MISKDGMPISSGDREGMRFFIEEIGMIFSPTKIVRKYLGEFSLQSKLSVHVWTSHTGQQIGVRVLS